MTDIDEYKILLFPVVTEDAVSLIENENKLVFIVNRNATRKDVELAFSRLYGVKVEKVNVAITSKGEKKAFIKLKPESKASDLAVKIGVL